MAARTAGPWVLHPLGNRSHARHPGRTAGPDSRLGFFMRLTTLSLAAALLVASPVRAADEKVKIDDQTKKAIDKALVWLKDHQQRDGSWGNTAVTSFALLAFMANGHVPNQGTYGETVSKGVRYLLACVRDNPNRRDDGYLVGDRGGNMYCHGMAALALTQVYGMTGDKEVRDVLKKAIDLIIRTQSREGGWRYDPNPDAGADISVTIMQVMALRGAKDGGIQVLVILTAATLLFHVPMVGDPLVLAAGLLVFIVANLAVGFLFSTVASNQLQAMQMSFFFFLPSILMSGFMFPFRGMPDWAQTIGEALPLTHFLRVVRGVMLKGNTMADTWPDIWPMLAFLGAVSVLAVMRYRQTLD